MRQQEPVQLRDNVQGVQLEFKPRLIQHMESRGRAYHCSLNPDWLSQLNLDEQGAESLHSITTSQRPVIVQHPAIIIQPAELINNG